MVRFHKFWLAWYSYNQPRRTWIVYKFSKLPQCKAIWVDSAVPEARQDRKRMSYGSERRRHCVLQRADIVPRIAWKLIWALRFWSSVSICVAASLLLVFCGYIDREVFETRCILGRSWLFKFTNFDKSLELWWPTKIGIRFIPFQT